MQNQRRLKKLDIRLSREILLDEKMLNNTLSNDVQSFRFKTNHIDVTGKYDFS